MAIEAPMKEEKEQTVQVAETKIKKKTSSASKVKKEEKTKVADKAPKGQTVQNRLEGNEKQGTPQKKNPALDLGDRMKYGTHCMLTVTERSINHLMDIYKNIFVLDTKLNFTYFKDQGFNAFSNGAYEKAIDFFLLSLDKGGNHDTEVLFYLGLSYVNIEQYKKGLKYLKKAELHDSDDEDIISEIGQCLIKLEQYEEAVTYYKKALLFNSSEVTNYYMLGTAYEKNEQFDQAIEMYRKAIDLDPRDPLYYHALGFVFESIDKHDDAITCFKKAMELEKER